MQSQLAPVVNVQEFLEVIEFEFTVSKKKKPIIGLGQPGIGKTQGVAGLAKRLGIGFIDLRLTNYSEVDFKGVPSLDDEHGTTRWFPTDTLPQTYKHGETGILLLDEITGAMPAVRLAVMQLLEAGHKLGEYVLPEGWLIVLTGNREEDGVEFYSPLSNPLINRCQMYIVQAGLSEFKAYGRRAGIHPMVLAYLTWSQASLYVTPPEGAMGEISVTPRTWEDVSDRLYYLDDGKISPTLCLTTCKAFIGNFEAQKFFTFLKFRSKEISAEDILEGKEVPKIDEIEVLHITIQNLVSKLVEMVNKEYEVRSSISKEVLQKCANVFTWLFNLEKQGKLEHAVMGFKDIKRGCSEHITDILMDVRFDEMCPTWAAFAERNANIFA